MSENAERLAALAALLQSGRLLTEADEMAPFLTDWRGRYDGRALAVVQPRETAEVAHVVQFCAEHAIPLVPQGGNTGLCGGATPDVSGEALVLNLVRMNRVRDIDIDNNCIVVEAGCTLASVQEAAADAGRYFPLSLASEGSCTIGGNISTNAGGVHVLRYGNMRDLVLGLEVVLPDGRLWHGLRALRKDNTGYDLKHLFIGAEGTLGVVTAAALKLFPRPSARATAWLAVPDPASAVRLLAMLRDACGDRVCAFEIISRVALDLVLRHVPGARNPLPDDTCAWYVLAELSDGGDSPELARMFERVLEQALEASLTSDAVVAGNLSQLQALWALRENISEAQRIEGVSIKHDVAVPVSRIPEFLERADSLLRARWPDIRIVAFGHIGDGNLHYNLSKDDALDNAAFIGRTPEANRIVHDLIAELEGSISAEHGLGQLKREEILRYKSGVEMDVMRALKSALDLRQLMNPGKVL
ncbi:MAG: FAD-binding oxidoreductase [Rhodocyclaceae bacterium]